MRRIALLLLVIMAAALMVAESSRADNLSSPDSTCGSGTGKYGLPNGKPNYGGANWWSVPVQWNCGGNGDFLVELQGSSDNGNTWTDLNSGTNTYLNEDCQYISGGACSATACSGDCNFCGDNPTFYPYSTYSECMFEPDETDASSGTRTLQIHATCGNNWDYYRVHTWDDETNHSHPGNQYSAMNVGC